MTANIMPFHEMEWKYNEIRVWNLNRWQRRVSETFAIIYLFLFYRNYKYRA